MVSTSGPLILETPTSSPTPWRRSRGKAFACVGLEGHTLVIVKALYGLKSSGARWWEVLADVLCQMGFTPSKADNDIWMRRVGGLYEHVVAYVDNLGIASSDPYAIIKQLEGSYGFQLKGTGPTSFHLGCDYYQDGKGVLCIAPKKYSDKMLDSYQRIFGSKPCQYSTPLEHGDHPKIDDSEELGLDDIKKFQSMIGALQWVIQIGHFDINNAVMTLLSFQANPHLGHFNRCKRIYGYLYKMRNTAIRIQVDEPDYSVLPTKVYDWEQSIYTGAEELIPDDNPIPLGKPVVMTTFVDANLYHDLVMGKSVSSILHLFNKTVIDWYSKKQGTVETNTYGSEFVAACTAMEQIIDLHIKLRYLGVPIKGSTTMFGDNESVVNSTSIPHATYTSDTPPCHSIAFAKALPPELPSSTTSTAHTTQRMSSASSGPTSKHGPSCSRSCSGKVTHWIASPRKNKNPNPPFLVHRSKKGE
jgi:Reverse transcriptase (RNA-dependent DNA polymerase)